MQEWRPRLTETELKFLIQVLEQTCESSQEARAKLEAEIAENESTLDREQLERLERAVVVERRREVAAEGLARRFRGLVAGGKPRRDVVSELATFAASREQ